MTAQELVVRLTLYRKEIYRRGIVILLCSLLPGLAVILGGGMMLGFHTAGDWRFLALFIALFAFLLLNLIAYFYMIGRSLPKKLDLFCPSCGDLVMDTPAQDLLATGKCGNCGSMILTAPSPVPAGIQAIPAARIIPEELVPGNGLPPADAPAPDKP